MKDLIFGEIVFNKEFEDNLMVVLKFGYYFFIGVRVCIGVFFDEGIFKEVDEEFCLVDLLKFVDLVCYLDCIKKYEKESGFIEVVICGIGEIYEILVLVVVMDFCFCGGVMGLVVGEKIICVIEVVLKKKIFCIIFSVFGGVCM